MQRFVVGCFLAALLLCRALPGSAQPVTDGEGDLGIGTLRPHPSALLDLASASKGILLPRMTAAQRDAISRPAPGLLLYNTTDSLVQINCGDETRPIWCTLVRERPGGGLTAQLSPGALWYGGPDSSVIELPPGPDGAVLRIEDGEPVWDVGSLLPSGTGANTTLRWDGTDWVENTNLRSDAAGNTTAEGNITVNGATVTMPNLPTTGAGSTVVITDGSGNLRKIDVNDLLGNATLSQNGLWAGDAANHPAELLSTNVPGAVLQQDGAGSPVWDDRLNVNSVTVDSLTVNEYANITNNVFTTDSSTFNTNVVFNDTAQFNSYTNINGVQITVDSTANFWNAVTINVDSTVVNNVFVSNDSSYFNGPVSFGDTVIFNTLPSLPLSEDAMYVGNAANVAVELPGGSNGDVLTINGTTPTWTANPGGLLPEGTVPNTTLVWDNVAGEWIENTEVTLDPTNGNTAINGDLNVAGTTVSVPNIPATTTSTTVVVTDGAGNMQTTGIDDLLGNATLTEDNLWVGDAANNPSELAPGADGDVLTINGTTPTWMSNPGGLLPGGTVPNSTLRWDGTDWVENTNLRSDAAGNTTVNGPTVSVPNIPATTTSTTVVVTDGAGNMQTTGIDDLLGNATLTEDNLWVGDAANNPSELAPGADGDVLTITGTTPTWQSINLLPPGSANNTTLVWDNVAGEWIENTEVTLDPTNGNTVINGDLNVAGPTVSVPNIPSTTTSTTVVVTDGAGNMQTTGIDDLLGNATLTEDNLWVGDAANNPSELAPGADGDVLTINGTTPTWQSINLLPPGSANNTTLVWDNVAGEWIENTEVTLDPTNGNTVINGDLNVAGDATLNGTTVSVPNIPATTTSTTVVVTDGAGNMQTTGIDDLLGNATLTEDNLWVGDAANNPSELAPGADGDVLTINGTTPTWMSNPGGLLPGGTVPNSTLRWDGTDWVENTNLQSDAAGNTTVNGATVSVPNIPATTTSTTVVVTDGAGNMQTTGIDDLLGNATLTEDNLWVGDAANNPSELAPGADGDVLTINGTTPTWQSINLLPPGSANNTTLVWDNVAGEWIENTEVTLDPTNGNTAINGDLNVAGTTVSVPNIPNVLVGTDVVITDGTGNLQTIDVDDLLGNATLTEDNLWVGDAANNPSELAPGTVDQVLQIDAGGSPGWQSINLLPPGSANNTTLVWDNVAGEWIENTEVTLDPTNGNTAINGDLNVAGDATLNGPTVSVPNIPSTTTSTTVVVTDGAGNMQTTGIDDLLGNATLTEDNLWVGDAANNPSELAPGADGDVLTINGTTPTWQSNPGGLLPGGTVPNSTLRWDGTDWVENTNLRSDASGNTTAEGDLVVNGVVSANGAGNTIGDNTAGVQLTVDGVADAVVGNTLAGNPTVWDQVVDGDLVATGLVKVGGSMWIDGTTANNHQIASNDDLNIGTTTTENLSLSTDGTAALIVSGTTQQVNVESALNLNGANVPLLVDGAVGTAGQALVSAGPGVTPAWETLDAGNLALSQHAMFVGDATNTAAELPATADRVLTTDGTGLPAWRSTLPTGVTVGFDQITSGTNTAATMNVGTGSSLQPTGSGTVTSNRFVGSGSTTNGVDLATAEVSGTLPINRGGTNGTALPTAGAVAYGTGSAYAFSSAGSSGNLLVSSGAGAPTWANPNNLFWQLNGNSGTLPVMHFLGTTDALPLNFRTNNVERMRITSSGLTGLLTASTAPRAFLHIGFTASQDVPGLLVGTDYTVNGVAGARSIFPSESWFAYPGIVGIGDRGSTNDIPSIAPYGTVGIVGTSGGGTGGRTEVGVYGHGYLSNTFSGNPNHGWGGLFRARITSAVTDFNGSLIGVRAEATSTGGLSSTGGPSPNPDGGEVYGLYSSAVGNPTDTTFGGYFSATGATTNFGVYSNAGTNYFASRVGIGTTEPSTALHVTAASDPLRLGGLVADNTIDNVLVADAAGVVHSRTVSSLVGDMPLTEDHIWVGDAANVAAELPPGADGDVLTINGTTPTWTSNPGGLLPGGTTLNSTLRWDGTDWVENTNLRSDASGNTTAEGDLVVNGVVSANGAGNTIGDNTAGTQLTVDGVADAVVGNTLAGNPTVWDQVVDGDLVATGLVKVGGSVWIDGTTTDNHRIAADDNLDVGTTTAEDLTLSTNGTVGLRVVGASQRINIESELNLRGGGTPLLAGGTAGTAGQALVSAGPGVTPAWETLDAGNLALSQHAMFVGDATNTAAELPATADRVLTTDGTGLPAWRSTLPTGVTVGFDQITSGTNTAATMNVGTGASLQPTGSGTVTSNRFVGSGSTTNGVDLATAEVSGTLPINRGGTNGTALPTAGAVAYGTGSAYAFSAAGSSGNLLTSSGAGAPTWANPNGLFWQLNGNSGTAPASQFIGTTDAVRLAFRTNNTERMTLSTSGHLGLGTTNPGGIITIINDDVADVTDDFIMTTYSDTYTPLLRITRTRGTLAAPTQLLQNDVIGLMSFSGNSSTLIGAQIVAVADANHSVADQSTRIEFVTNDGATTATRMTIDDDGRVGIGTTSPNAAVHLHVVGDAGKTAGGTTWVNLSDGRMKDVQGDYTKGLAEIIGLKPVVYRYKPENTWGAPSDVDQYGFIAQEVETVFPEAVSTGDDGYLVFNMHPILVAYANAVKELNAKVETLEEENVAMRTLLEDLRSRVEALEGE